MAARGQRFELDLNSENWSFDVAEQDESSKPLDVVKEIRERDISAVPAAPALKANKTGFPEHRPRKFQSTFKQQQVRKGPETAVEIPGPSDRAILHHAAAKQGIDLAGAKQKTDIDRENKARLNEMTLEEIEEARSELMAQINPEALRKFLRRANVDDENERQQKEWEDHEAGQPSVQLEQDARPVKPTGASREKPISSKADNPSTTSTDATEDMSDPQSNTLKPPPADTSNIHFPAPPRNKSDYKSLDPTSDSFLKDLRDHYFPDLPQDPNALTWLADPTPTEDEESPYNPERAGFAPSALRFNFNGTLIPPSESLTIPTSKGLHHHGDAPSSAGYTVPELTLLARSTLPNQRCVAYQVIGRILYRLGRGDFGPRGGEMTEGLWTCIERERIVESTMAEANREKTHLSAKAFATEALWLWRRGGGGDRGVLKEGERRAT